MFIVSLIVIRIGFLLLLFLYSFSTLGLKIHVSESTKLFLEKAAHGTDFDLTLRGEIDVKGKGKMTTYWLNGMANGYFPTIDSTKQRPSLCDLDSTGIPSQIDPNSAFASPSIHSSNAGSSVCIVPPSMEIVVSDNSSPNHNNITVSPAIVPTKVTIMLNNGSSTTLNGQV